jgi:hypothetical protein
MNHPLRERADEFIGKYPTVWAKLKACHARGMSATDAANDPEVSAEFHKQGCIGLLTFIAFVAIVNEIWDLWDHFANL